MHSFVLIRNSRNQMRSACTHHLSAPQVIYKKQTCQSNKQGAKPLKMKRRHHQKKEHTVFILCGTYLTCMYNIGRTKKFNFFTSYSAYHSVQRSRKKMCYNPCPDFFMMIQFLPQWVYALLTSFEFTCLSKSLKVSFQKFRNTIIFAHFPH